MMIGVMTKPVELFNVKISSLKRDFTINTEVTKVHKRELLSLENPRWTIISAGKEVDLTLMFMTQTSSLEYETLCRLDVLGIADSASGDQDEVYSEFKGQLKRDEEGWYETGLLWKGNHPSL